MSFLSNPPFHPPVIIRHVNPHLPRPTDLKCWPALSSRRLLESRLCQCTLWSNYFDKRSVLEACYHALLPMKHTRFSRQLNGSCFAPRLFVGKPDTASSAGVIRSKCLSANMAELAFWLAQPSKGRGWRCRQPAPGFLAGSRTPSFSSPWSSHLTFGTALSSDGLAIYSEAVNNDQDPKVGWPLIP